MKLATIGIDLAKAVFQVLGVDERGKVLFRKRASTVGDGSTVCSATTTVSLRDGLVRIFRHYDVDITGPHFHSAANIRGISQPSTTPVTIMAVALYPPRFLAPVRP